MHVLILWDIAPCCFVGSLYTITKILKAFSGFGTIPRLLWANKSGPSKRHKWSLFWADINREQKSRRVCSRGRIPKWPVLGDNLVRPTFYQVVSKYISFHDLLRNSKPSPPPVKLLWWNLISVASLIRWCDQKCMMVHDDAVFKHANFSGW
jgi:hypothetical protein